VVSSQIDCEPLPVAGCRLPCAEARAQTVRACQSTTQSRGTSGTVGALQIHCCSSTEARKFLPAAVPVVKSTFLAATGNAAQNNDVMVQVVPVPVMGLDSKCAVETEAAPISDTRKRQTVTLSGTPLESVSRKQSSQAQSIAIQTEVVLSRDILNQIPSASLPSVLPVSGEGAPKIMLLEKSSLCAGLVTDRPSDSRRDRIKERDPTDEGPHQSSRSEEVACRISVYTNLEVNIRHHF
jgi:hypothetical protein